MRLAIMRHGMSQAESLRRSVPASCDQPRNRAVVDIVGAGDFPDRLAFITATKCFLSLMRRQLRLAPHLHASCFGTLPAFACPCPDQLAIKLRKATQDSEYQPAVCRCGVGPSITQEVEAGVLVSDSGKGVQQIPRRTRQPIEPGHHQQIATLEPSALGFGATRDFAEHL